MSRSRLLELMLGLTLVACVGDDDPPPGDDDDDEPPIVDSGEPVDTAEPVDTGEPAAGAPEVVRFFADPPGLDVGGGETTLSWEITDADSVTIDGAPVAGDSLVVSVNETTAFTLVATNDEGSAEARTLVITKTAGPPPFDRSAPTSVDLIDEALEAGEIDPITALRYEVFALFADPRLPDRFASDGRIHGSPILKDLRLAFDDLPPDVQAELRPFLLPPTDPESWYHLDENVPGARQAGAFDVHIPVSTPQGEVWVWYESAAFEPKVERYIEATVPAAVGAAWPKLVALMGEQPIQHVDFAGEDDVYHVYVVDSDAKSDLGWCTPGTFDSGLAGWPSHVVVNLRGIAEDIGDGGFGAFSDLTAATTAHELMHGFQMAFDQNEPGSEAQSWLDESSATWSEHHVYPPFDTEHVYNEAFLSAPSVALENTDGNHHYGGWLFHLYVDRELGPDTIRQMYENASEGTALEAVAKAIGDFEYHYARFSAFNWNAGSADAYLRWDGVSEGVSDHIDVEPVVVPAKQEIYEMALSGASPIGPLNGVESLTARYFHFDLSDPAARSLLFANGYTHELRQDTPPPQVVPVFDETFLAETVPDNQREGARVMALVKSGGVWLPEPIDLSEIAFVPFCQLYEEESIEEIVFVFTNSRHEPGDRDPVVPPADQPAFFASNMACGDWAGTASVEIRIAEEDQIEITDVFMGDLTFERPRHSLIALLDGAGQLSFGETILPRDALFFGIFLGAGYELTTADVTWSTDKSSGSGASSCTATGSGTFDESDAQVGQLFLAPLLTGPGGDPNALYRSYFVELFFVDLEDQPVTVQCANGSTSRSPFGTALVGGFRNTELGLFEVSDDGLFIRHTWSLDDGDTTFEIDLVGLSD